MSRRIQPMGLFLLMLWLPPLLLLGLRLAGCSPMLAEPAGAGFHAPAQDAGYSAPDAEGVPF